MDAAENGVAEVRAGPRLFVVAAEVLCRDPRSRLCELYRERAELLSEPGANVHMELPAVLAPHLGAVLRFYETGTIESIPEGGEPRQAFVRAARELNACALLERLGEPMTASTCNGQAAPTAATVSAPEPPRERRESDAVARSDGPLQDEERIFNHLMGKMSESKHAGPAETCEVSVGGAGVEKGDGAPADAGQDLENRIARLEAKLAELDQGAAGQNTATCAAPAEGPRPTSSLRARETIKVEIQRLRYERDQARLAAQNKGRELAYNLLVVGVTGTGKSSSLNTLLNQQLCKVSGAQAQGTRGCNMQDGFISDEHFVSFIDTQGLGADTSVTDTELLSQIMMSTESITRMRIINNILISFDTNTRATPATMANQLTLMELFGELRQSCFLILTKWNTNAVQSEWNTPLRRWVRKWRRAATLEEITEDPPTYQVMYEAYCAYLVSAMNNDEDAGAFSKMGTFLSFFQGRLLFMYNLDAVEIEDLEAGELEPHIVRLYNCFRDRALQCLRQGSTAVPVDELTFLREDGDTLSRVAGRLVAARDQKIQQLEKIGYDAHKRSQMSLVFADMAQANCSKIGTSDYAVQGGGSHLEDIATLAGFSGTSTNIGCVLQ